jgi:hypothetical protein
MELVDASHTEGSDAGDRSPLALSELRLLASRYHRTYVKARPWPHLVLDDVVNPDLVAEAEVEELQRALSLKVHGGNRIVKAESPEVVGRAANGILDSLLAPEFVAFLEKVTGIHGLIPDPGHVWAGIHVSPPGASQALHRDFRFHPTSGLYHRVNALVYLNSDWKKEYGGELELWPADPEAGGKQILPKAGRIVIFETTSSSYHGVPDPVRCPAGRARLSLASYYYSNHPGPDDRRETIFVCPKRPQDPWYMNFRPLKDGLSNLWYTARDYVGHGGAEKWARGRRFRRLG